jgi:serine/threonine-protein kinase
MTTLASTLMYEGKYSEADALLQQALVTQQRVYGNMHPRVAYVLNVLGSVAIDGRDFNAAEDDFRRVGEIYRSAYGDGDYRVAVAMENLASAYFKEGKFTPAEQMFRDVVQRFTKALSADNINTGITEVKLGRTLLSERRYREAEEQTRTGYEVLQKQTSSSTSFVQAARHDLVAIYEALGRPEDARKFREMPTQPPEPRQ